MGILHLMLETYDNNAELAGLPISGRVPLTPISHTVQNAHIEVCLNEDGEFVSASKVPKEENKTIIPVTEESAIRSGASERPHPLCDQLRYIAGHDESKYSLYVKGLTNWVTSPYFHFIPAAVLKYIKNRTLLADLAAAEVIELTEKGIPANGKINGDEYDKCLVRWRVYSPTDKSFVASWEDPGLFKQFISYYELSQKDRPRGVCIISGKEDMIAEKHPKGIIAANFGAKLISSNDRRGFTYRGRFVEPSDSGYIGYTTSQKIHSAFRWISANQGILIGEKTYRTYMCWNPSGHPVPRPDYLNIDYEKMHISDEITTSIGYRRVLEQALRGDAQTLRDTDDVVILGIDAATTGRLSITYYEVLSGSAFLNRLEEWYGSCSWLFRQNKDEFVRSPSVKQIINCAFGNQRGNIIQADGALIKEQSQRLLHCIIDSQPVPVDIVRALVERVSRPQNYATSNREFLLFTACAVVRKYLNDKIGSEVWTMVLDPENVDRSYLFGRLLAIAEFVERITYSRNESREPNAMRYQTLFTERPMYAWGILEKQLAPYYSKLYPGARVKYKNMISEIIGMLPSNDLSELNKRLDSSYLLGYYLQRRELYKGKTKETTENDEV